MTVVRHRFAPEPPDPAASLWRFMAMRKLEHLLRTGTIWMTRANGSGDGLDGSYTDTNVAHYNQTLVELYGAYGEWLAARLPAWNKALTGWIYLNCWFMHEHESAAMWSYAGHETNDRVAVRSTVGDLKEAVTDQREVYLGQIRYIDFGTDMFDRGNALPPYVTKARHFDSEREVRLVHVGEFPGRYIVDDPPAHDGPEGLEFAVDLRWLIRDVVVGPESTTDLQERVDELLGGGGLPNSRRSELERRARF